VATTTYEVSLPCWTKGQKVKCPGCGKKVGAPYVCKKCDAHIKIKVHMNFK